ncbi:MAG: lytic murein transglycosylase B [Pseudomonadota bacterium]
MYKLSIILFLITTFSLQANDSISVTKEEFIDQMMQQHQFNSNDLNKLLDQAKVSKTILDAISRPAEKKLVWHEYKNIFLKEKRINEGVTFLLEHKDTLKRAEDEYGIPPEIIVAIIGVETFYGRITGKYRVLDALNTLAFHYPRRSNFFRSELKHFLLLSREQGFDPLTLTGSYAGAMGMPQFISSSYRNFAIDFDGDGITDIWDNPVDVIGSIANYFHRHDWRRGQDVIDKLYIEGNIPDELLTKGLKPDIKLDDLRKHDIKLSKEYSNDEPLKILKFEQKTGSEYWLARKNFYVITRYNHSELYAMAVYQLAKSIKQKQSSLVLK